MSYFKQHRHLFAMMAGILFVTIGIVAFVPPAHAADCGGIETSVIDCSSAKDETGSPVVAILVVAIQLLTGLVGIVAIGAFIYAGIMYSSASGNASQTAKAKEIIRNTVIGLVLFAGMVLVLNWLIPGGLFTGTTKFGAGGNGLGNVIIDDPDYGSDPDLDDPSSPGRDDSDIKSTSPYSLTLASWNTYVDNPTSKGATVKSLMSSFDVLGLQEVHKSSQRSSVKSIASSTIGVYSAPTPSSGDKHMASYPIVYNKSKLSLISGGYKYLGDAADISPRYIVYVRLKIKATGQEFYFANTHLPPSVESGGKPNGSAYAKAYSKMMPIAVSTVKQLEAKGLPTFLVGDFNVNFRRDKCTVSWFPCKALGSANMKSAFELTHLAGVAGSASTHSSGSRLIDYVFVKTDSRVTANSIGIVGLSDNSGYKGSDHRPSYARVTISAKAASSTPSPTTPSPGTGTPAPSSISLSGVENFRDLAKYNSNLVRSGGLYRSAKLQDATTTDRTKLASALKNGVIIDLRTSKMRASAPDKTISGVPNLNYDVDAADNAAEYVKIFVNDKTERLEFGAAITKIANTKGAALIHCTRGKDRTGWLAAMIMYSLGASDTQVMTEYLHSNDAGADFTVERSWLNAALSAARKNNGGSIMNYIKSSSNGLGVSDATITKLKAKLGK